MTHFIPRSLRILLAPLLLTSVTAALSADETLTSPNKQVQLVLSTSPSGQLRYSISYKGKTMIKTSPLGLVVNHTPLGSHVTLGKRVNYSQNSTIPVRGNHRTAVNHFQGALIDLTPKENDQAQSLAVQMDARAFDNGVAIRFIIRHKGEITHNKELTAFTVPSHSTIWAVPQYEEAPLISGMVYGKSPTFKHHLFLPITAQIPSGEYLAIMEADRHGSALRDASDLGNGQFRLNLFSENKSQDELRTSWRLFKLAPDLNALVNNDMIELLSPAPDPTLYPEGPYTSWLQPGVIAWSWMSGGGAKGVNLKNQMAFVDYAQQLGYAAVLVDEGWRHWNDEGVATCGVGRCKVKHGDTPWKSIQKLINYANKRKVKIWVWKAYDDRFGIPGIKAPKQRAAFFKRCQDMGIVGIKIDFFPPPSQEVMTWMTDTLREAAKYHLMVNFHGCAVPAGESHTYPNEMNREAIRGLEHRGALYISHTCIMPFNRYLAGHADFTPVHFGKGGASLASHLASPVILASPITHYSEHPLKIKALGEDVSKLVISIPTQWDQTIVLPDSKIDRLAAFARRKGKVWYLALLSNANQEITIPLDFLDDNLSYHTQTISEGKPTLTKINFVTSTATQQTTLHLKLKRGSGYLMRLTPISHQTNHSQ